MRLAFAFAAAAALACSAPGARAEALAPADALDPAFARAAREHAPKLVWHAEIERDAYVFGNARTRTPQRRVCYRGLVLPGGARALVAFFAREAVDADAAATPGSETLYYRVLDADGRPGARLPIAAGPDFGMFVDRGAGAAAVLGAWRAGTAPLLSIAADGRARTIALALPFRPLRFESHGAGFLVWLDRARPGETAGSTEKKGPFHLIRLDAEGRAQGHFEYPRGHYGFVATAARADGFTLAVLNEGPLRGIVQSVAALLLDRAGKRVAKHTLALYGEGGPVPTGLQALRGGGFLLAGFWWGPGGNFVAWLDRNGRLLRYRDAALGDFVEVQWIRPLGDEGFLATDATGALLRFDHDAKLLWRFARPPWPADPPGHQVREVWIYDLRVLAGNELLLAGSRNWDERPAGDIASVTINFIERYRFE